MRYFLTHPHALLAGVWTLAKIGAVYAVTLAQRAARRVTHRVKGGEPTC